MSPQRQAPQIAGGLSNSGFFNLKPVSASNLNQYLQVDPPSQPHSSQSLSQSAYDHHPGINSARSGYSIEPSPNPRNTVGGPSFNYLAAPMPQFQSNRLSVQPAGNIRQPIYEAEQYSSHLSESASPNPQQLQPQYPGAYPQQQGYLQGRPSNTLAPNPPPNSDFSFLCVDLQPPGAAVFPQSGPLPANQGHWNPQPSPTYPNQRFASQSGPLQSPGYMVGPPSPQQYQNTGYNAGGVGPQYYNPAAQGMQDQANPPLQPQPRNGAMNGPRGTMLVTSSPAGPQIGVVRQQSFNLEDQLNKNSLGQMSQSDLNYLGAPQNQTRSTSVGVRPGPTGGFAPRQGLASSLLQAPQFFSNVPPTSSHGNLEALGPRTRLGSGSANSPLKRLPIFDDPVPGNPAFQPQQEANNRSLHQDTAGMVGRASVDSRQGMMFGSLHNQNVLTQSFEGSVRNSGSRFAGIPEAAPTRATGGSYAPPQFRANYF